MGCGQPSSFFLDGVISNATPYQVKVMINKHLLMTSFRQKNITHGAQVSLSLPPQVNFSSR